MTRYDYLIIGGGIAGVTAAETIREKNTTATIGIISDEPRMLYSRVLLPSYLKKKINREQIFLRLAEDFTKKNIDFSVAEEVVSVDSAKRSVKLSNGLVLSYQKLLIATGGKVKPWGKKEDERFVHRLQTIEDADRLYQALPTIRNPLVVGSSFITLEFLEIFFLNSNAPVLLARDDYFFGRLLDPKGGELMAANFDRHGIKTYFGDALKEIKSANGELIVETERLQRLSCDALGVGIGLDLNTNFLRDSGIKLGDTNAGVDTNEFLETNVEGVYAAGDVAEFFDVIAGKKRALGNWTNAVLQGKTAGLNMAGERKAFASVSSYSITNLGLQITALGESSGQSEDIVRIDMGHNQYERLFLRDGRLVGAVLINRFVDKPHLTKLIETKTPVDAYRQKFADFTFDIRTIPVVG